jgi:hypothetical protein
MDMQIILKKLLHLKGFLEEEGSNEAAAMLNDIISSMTSDRDISGEITMSIAVRGIGKHVLKIDLTVDGNKVSKSFNFDEENVSGKIIRLFSLFVGQKINLIDLEKDEELIKEISNLINNIFYINTTELTNGDIYLNVGQTSIPRRIVNDFISKLT